MSDEIKRDVIARVETEIECKPIVEELSLGEEYTKISFGDISSMGAVFSAIAPALKAIFNNGTDPTKQLYKMIIPKGLRPWERLVVSKGGLIGNVANKRTGKITQRARYEKFDGGAVAKINPNTFFMALAIASITQKLDVIEEGQKEILEFLQLKERAVLKGNLTVMREILEEYKFNCDNEKYKSSKYNQVQEIKRDTEQSIIFYREKIVKKVVKKSLLHSDRDVKNKIERIQYEFKDYELAIYLFAFASFLEVMLLENFKAEYLSSVSKRIELYVGEYIKLNEECYCLIEKESKTSIQSFVLKGVAGINKAIGKGVAKIPKVKDGQVDETLIGAGEKVDGFSERRTEKTMGLFEKSNCSHVTPFIRNLQTLNLIYNDIGEILFDEDGLYLLTGEENGKV